MPLTSLAVVEAAIRAGWSRDTCDPVDLADWTPANPSRGQCGVTALVVHDLLGGTLLVADVLRTDGSRQGVHWWNRLTGGLELDLTRTQFSPHEHVQHPRELARPPGDPPRLGTQYRLLRHRVEKTLSVGPPQPESHFARR